MAIVYTKRVRATSAAELGFAADADTSVAVVAEPEAAAAETKGPDTTWTIIAFALIGASMVIAWLLYEWRDPDAFDGGASFSAFAPLYILAQAIERLLEPFAKFLAPTKDESTGETKTKDAVKREHDVAVAAFLKDPSDATANAAARSVALLQRLRRNTAVIAWGAASGLAIVVCGLLGIRLFDAIGFDAPAFLDLTITGLAIGSGTKPLHDLISNIQKASESKATPEGVAASD